jgi:hypothetical protein
MRHLWSVVVFVLARPANDDSEGVNALEDANEGEPTGDVERVQSAYQALAPPFMDPQWAAAMRLRPRGRI